MLARISIFKSKMLDTTIKFRGYLVGMVGIWIPDPRYPIKEGASRQKILPGKSDFY